MWARTLWRQAVVVKLNQLKEIHRAPSWSTGRCSCLVQASRLLSTQESIARDWIKLNSGPDHEPYSFTTDQEEFLTKGDAEMGRRLSKLQLQLYLKQQQGLILPENIQLQDVESMLPLTPIKLERFLNVLIKRSATHLREQQVKENHRKGLKHIREERKAKEADLDNPWLEYALFNNTLLPRISKGQMSALYDSYAFKDLDFGQKIVIDCSFESFMDSIEVKMLAKHIMLSFASNRKKIRPFSMHLCNLNQDGPLMHQLQKLNPAFAVDSPVGLHSCSYNNIFDRENLVYISQDARQPLQYNPNHIYIFGGLVDKNLGRKLCFKKARKERINCASLPFKHHVNWHAGGQPLSLNLHIDILLDVKNTGDWSQAISKHAPVRKLKQEYEEPFRKKHVKKM